MNSHNVELNEDEINPLRISSSFNAYGIVLPSEFYKKSF